MGIPEMLAGFVFVATMAWAVISMFCTATANDRFQCKLATNLAEIVEVATLSSPMFYGNSDGEDAILVRATDYVRELKDYMLDVQTGLRKEWEKPMLVITPAILLYRNENSRRNFVHAASLGEAERMVSERLRSLCGMNEDDFYRALNSSPSTQEELKKLLVKKSNFIFVPYKSEKESTFEQQKALFGKQTFATALKFVNETEPARNQAVGFCD